MIVLLSSATAISSKTDRGAFAFAAPKGVTATDVFNLIAPGEDQHILKIPHKRSKRAIPCPVA
jgi:hypothetical protein